MEEVAKETLELIKEGTKAMGQVGIDFWPELVRYNVALALASFGVSLSILGSGLFMIWFSLRDAKKKEVKMWDGRMMKSQELWVVIGAFLLFGGFIASLSNGYWVFAALYAPEAYTVMQVIGK